MVLGSIKIRNFGAVQSYSEKFSSDLNVVKTRHIKELSLAIRIISGHKITPPPDIRAGVDTEIEANILLSGKDILVKAVPNKDGNGFNLSCSDRDLRDVTEEYLYLTRHPREQDLSDVFFGGGETVLLRILKYASEDLYYPPGELSRKTEGLSRIKAFRKYLKDFIDGFKPEPLRDGVSYEIILEGNGRYTVRCRAEGSLTHTLSESERTLFRFLCFLHTAKFWEGFESIRNMHGIKKPLIISDFLERLDESIDTEALLLRAKKLNRQVFILRK